MKFFTLLALATSALALPSEEKRQVWPCDDDYTVVTGICNDRSSGPVCFAVRGQTCPPGKWINMQLFDRCSNVGEPCQTRITCCNDESGF
ncbi:hypothetical protein F66182_8563 [Fusarium sp. NRRL 66182]|nr:hypothetical protein F66182_8563 [Fusarium sp. NRRL 66182]